MKRRPKGAFAQCIYCGNTFEQPKPTTPMCQFCWFEGKHFEPTFRDLLAELRAIDGVASAYLQHTGGGCWALEVGRADGCYIMGTDATYDDDAPAGTPAELRWGTDAQLPETPDGPWMLGAYDADGEPDVRHAGNDDAIFPADRRTFVAYVRGWITKASEREQPPPE